jgi:hypothetical protein
MISFRPALVIVCVVFGILMNSCFGYYDDCFNTSETSYCNDSTINKIYASDEAFAWLDVASITDKQDIKFKSNTGAEIKFVTNDIERISAIEVDKYKYAVNNDCYENVNCPVWVKIYNNELTYTSFGSGLTLKFNFNRDTAENLFDTNDANWREYLSFKQGSTVLKFIPNKNSDGFAKQMYYPTLSLNNVDYTKVYHVYDSSLLNSPYLKIMGFYYNASNGLLRYYFNKNNDVWTKQ